MRMLRDYFHKQIDEIKNDTVLRIYGAFVAGGYLLCFRSWNRGYVAKAIALPEKAFCWPFFENCFAYRPFTVEQVQMIIYAYGIVALVGVSLFLFRKQCALAYWWLILVTVFKTLIYVQDYSLRMNQHYMLYFITVIYLFFPFKRQVLRVAMVLFYFWASTLKFNPEWLSGQALTGKPWGVPWRLLSASCWYAAILESVIVWGALSANRWIFWFAVSQLYLFHITSFSVVGKFYPLLMFMLLAIFPMTRLFPNAAEPKSQLKSLFTGKQPHIVYIFILFFSCLQLIPVLIPGDEKITGEGRLFALHMIDANVQCEGMVTLKYKGGAQEEISIPLDFYIKRTTCEPALNFAMAKRTCYLHRQDPQFNDLDIAYQSRRRHEKNMKPVVDIKDFCSKNLSYDLLHPNDWIIHSSK